MAFSGKMFQGFTMSLVRGIFHQQRILTCIKDMNLIKHSWLENYIRTLPKTVFPIWNKYKSTPKPNIAFIFFWRGSAFPNSKISRNFSHLKKKEPNPMPWRHWPSCLRALSPPKHLVKISKSEKSTKFSWKWDPLISGKSRLVKFGQNSMRWYCWWQPEIRDQLTSWGW